MSRLVTEPRASLDEVKDFCNRVREAGNGEMLPDLLPSTPRNSTLCLIAKNLNFACSVTYLSTPLSTDGEGFARSRFNSYADGERKWYMIVDDADLRETISSALGLAIETGEGLPNEMLTGILLPRKIGRVAAAYDKWWENAAKYDATTDSWTLDLRDEFASFVEEQVIEQTTSLDNWNVLR